MKLGRKKTTATAKVPVPGMGGLVSANPADLVASYAATNQKLYEQSERLKVQVESLKGREEVLEQRIYELEAQRDAVRAAVGADVEIADLEQQLCDARRRMRAELEGDDW